MPIASGRVGIGYYSYFFVFHYSQIGTACGKKLAKGIGIRN